jgi:hypothetical protein
MHALTKLRVIRKRSIALAYGTAAFLLMLGVGGMIAADRVPGLVGWERSAVGLTGFLIFLWSLDVVAMVRSLSARRQRP